MHILIIKFVQKNYQTYVMFERLVLLSKMDFNSSDIKRTIFRLMIRSDLSSIIAIISPALKTEAGGIKTTHLCNKYNEKS